MRVEKPKAGSPMLAATARLIECGWLPKHTAMIRPMAEALRTGRIVRLQKIDGHAVIDFVGK